MKNVIALIIMSGAIGRLMWLGADIYFFMDVPSALYIVLFLYRASLIAFGSEGTLKSIYSLKYLFTAKRVGAPKHSI